MRRCNLHHVSPTLQECGKELVISHLVYMVTSLMAVGDAVASQPISSEEYDVGSERGGRGSMKEESMDSQETLAALKNRSKSIRCVQPS